MELIKAYARIDGWTKKIYVFRSDVIRTLVQLPLEPPIDTLVMKETSEDKDCVAATFHLAGFTREGIPVFDYQREA